MLTHTHLVPYLTTSAFASASTITRHLDMISHAVSSFLDITSLEVTPREVTPLEVTTDH